MCQKEYYLGVCEFLEREIHAFVGKLSDRCFSVLVSGHHVGAHPPPWLLLQISIVLGKKNSPVILHKKNCCDLNLGENL